jgi:hypothetical protein
MPNVIQVRQLDWDNYNPPFDADQSFRVMRGEEDNSFDFYVNLDCRHLIGYLKATKDEEHDLVRHWFQWGLTLCALGLLHGFGLIGDETTSNGSKPQSTDGAEVPDAVEMVNRSINGLGAVIVPIIKNLYHPLVPSAA